MPTFGLRPDDLLRDSRGDVMIDVKQTFYASRPDAEMQQNPLGSVTTRKDGRWEFTNDATGVFGRDSDGNIRFYDSEEPKLTTAVANATFGARTATAATAANTARLSSTLRRGVQDAKMLVVGDSTGNETTEWVYLLGVRLGQRFNYTVVYQVWDAVGGAAYSAPVTAYTGTSGRTLTIYNASVAGSVPGYFMGSRWNAAIRDIGDPDLVFISHGHNMGDPTGTQWQLGQGRAQMMGLTEELMALYPEAGVVLIAQNPVTTAGRTTWSAFKATTWEKYAGMRGLGFIDIHQAFLDYGPWAANLMLDDVHPNGTGQVLWTDQVERAIIDSREARPTLTLVPPLLTSAKNYLTNGDFSAWAATVPDGWTATASADVTKDTTNVETGAQAMKVTGNATSGAAQIEQAIVLSTAGMRHLAGQLVTLCVRVYVPTANTQTVRISLVDATGGANAANADAQTVTKDRYFWLYATKRIDPATTTLWVRLNSRTSGTTVADASFDRAFLVRGAVPLCGG